MAVTWSIENIGSSPDNVFVVFMGSFLGWGNEGKGFLFKLCVSQVNRIILDSLPCQQGLGEAEVLCMAEN